MYVTFLCMSCWRVSLVYRILPKLYEHWLKLNHIPYGWRKQGGVSFTKLIACGLCCYKIGHLPELNVFCRKVEKALCPGGWCTWVGWTVRLTRIRHSDEHAAPTLQAVGVFFQLVVLQTATQPYTMLLHPHLVAPHCTKAGRPAWSCGKGHPRWKQITGKKQEREVAYVKDTKKKKYHIKSSY